MVRLRVAALVTGALMLLALAGPAAAAPGVEQFCTDNNNFGVSHGTCVSIIQAESNNGNADPVAFCKIFELEVQQAGFPPFPLGQCVSYVRQNGIP